MDIFDKLSHWIAQSEVNSLIATMTFFIVVIFISLVMFTGYRLSKKQIAIFFLLSVAIMFVLLGISLIIVLGSSN